MTKYVVRNNQVAHLWAHQSQSRAKGNGSHSFEGRSIYSYAAEIGRIVDAPDGSLVALLISRTWSPTTSAHQSHARGAVSHMPHFTVPCIAVRSEQDHAGNLAYLIKQYEDEVGKLRRARNVPSDWNFEYLATKANEATRYAVMFALAAPAILYETDRANIEAIHNAPDRVAKRALKAAQEAELKAAREAREAVLRAQRIAANAEAINEWRACLRSSLPHGATLDSQGGALVRVNLAGDTLQTSRGAEVPLSDAIRVFNRVAACKAAGRSWHRNGEQIQVGSFQVDSIEADGSFVAGCHRFSWSEIAALAEKIGVLITA